MSAAIGTEPAGDFEVRYEFFQNDSGNWVWTWVESGAGDYVDTEEHATLLDAIAAAVEDAKAVIVPTSPIYGPIIDGLEELRQKELTGEHDGA